jgi:hypothetical protein
MALVKRRREEDIRRLRPVVSNEGIVRRALKVEILEVDIGEAVTRGRQVDQPSSCADQRRDAVDEDKVAQVIGAELRFIAIGRTAERVAITPAFAMMTSKGFPAVSNASAQARFSDWQDPNAANRRTGTPHEGMLDKRHVSLRDTP